MFVGVWDFFYTMSDRDMRIFLLLLYTMSGGDWESRNSRPWRWWGLNSLQGQCSQPMAAWGQADNIWCVWRIWFLMLHACKVFLILDSLWGWWCRLVLNFDSLYEWTNLVSCYRYVHYHKLVATALVASLPHLFLASPPKFSPQVVNPKVQKEFYFVSRKNQPFFITLPHFPYLFFTCTFSSHFHQTKQALTRPL